MKRYAFTLKILLGLFATLAVMVMLLGWRLSIGPIALDWAGDHLKKALSSGVKNVSIDFRDAVLIWRQSSTGAASQASGFQVVFYEVRIVDHKNDFALNLPEAAAYFSGLAMLRGLLAPTDVEITGLSINYTLGPNTWTSTDGRPFMEKLEAFLENLQSSNNVPFKVAQQLLSPPRSSSAGGYLRQISLLDTDITISDQLSGHEWRIPSASLGLQRADPGLSVSLSGDISMGSTRIMPLDIFMLFDNVKKEAVTTIEFSGLRPSAFAGEVEALSGLANLDIPAQGNMQFTINQDFAIPVMAFNLSLGKGQINPANIYPQPLNITHAAISGHILRNESSVVLDTLSLLLGKTHINGAGLLYGSLDKPGIAINADITDLPFLDLKTYWPGHFGKGAHKWITRNIAGGVVPRGRLEVNIKPDMWPQEPDVTQDEKIPAKITLPAEALIFKFDFNNIAAHYLRPMPILTDMSGQAELDLQTFHLKATGGKIDRLAIKKADLVFTDIHLKGEGAADITLELEGTVEEILRIIDYKPLGYPTKYGIRQGSITGQATAVVSLGFPLLKNIRLNDVTFNVAADVKSLAIPELNESLAIEDGGMHLYVDGKGITAEGMITLNGVKFKTRWLENFTDTEEFPTKYVINGFIEGAQWEQLHLPFDPYIEGPVEIDLALYGKGGTLDQGSGQFNLLASEGRFAPIGWKKEKGRAAHVGFDLQFDGPGQINIRNIILQSDSLQAELEIDLVDGWVNRFFIPKLVMKDTSISMLMEWDEKRNYYLSSLSGKSFYASPLIEILMATGGDEEDIDLPDFNIMADVESLRAKNNVSVKDINLSAIYREQDFTHLIFDGKLSEGKGIKVTIVPNMDNRRLEFTSTDAGEALRGLGMFNLGIGGDMLIAADMIKHEHGVSLGGQAEVVKFKVIESPGFSKLLAEKKFEKAQEELQKGGLSFNDFNMDFRTYNGVMEINKGRARGSNLGITIDGTVDQAYDEMHISGTLIPAYGLNSLLSNIPLIGTILTGGKGQGIFAATYSVNGPLDDPEISINPLAVLTPGIFRNIFSAIGSSKKKTLREQAEEMENIMPNTPPDAPPEPVQEPQS